MDNEGGKMIAIGLLVFTLILILIGMVSGFRRGILKEGIRCILWVGLFIVSCLFVPMITETLILTLAKIFHIEAIDTEQIIVNLLMKIEILKNSTYLVLPVAYMIRSFLVPFVVSLLYWICGIVSGLLYLIISPFCFRNKVKENKKKVEIKETETKEEIKEAETKETETKEEIKETETKETETKEEIKEVDSKKTDSSKEKKQRIAFKIAGLVMGVAFALLSGMITLYPVAEISKVVEKEEVKEILKEQLKVSEEWLNMYEGTPVQMVYQFTGMEWLGKEVHSAVIDTVILEKGQNIWEEFSNITQFAFDVLDTYLGISESSDMKFEHQLKQVTQSYFSLNFMSEEKKVELLNDVKVEIVKNIGNDSIIKIADAINMQSKEQVMEDIAIYGALVDLCKEEGVIDALKQDPSSFNLTKEFVTTVLDKLYLLSNANVVVPEGINFLYSTLLTGEYEELISKENFVVNEQTKADISEIFDVMYRVIPLLDDMDSLLVEQKKELLDVVQQLKNNKTLGEEKYEMLFRRIMNMM